jgi:hypothetical protein
MLKRLMNCTNFCVYSNKKSDGIWGGLSFMYVKNSQKLDVEKISGDYP